MKLANKIISKFKDERGVTAVIIAVTLAMLLGFAALAIDVGYLYATKNELQNAADAAALAAAGKLGEIYLDTADPESYVCDRATILPSVHAVVGAGKNRAGGKDISIRDADIFINNIEDAGTKFDEDNLNQPDAVRVIVRRDSIINNNVSTFFAKIFGTDSVPVTADATAALTGVDKIAVGGLPIPVGIGKKRFESEYCDKPIKFYPTSDIEACGGWHVFTDDKTKIKQDILDGMIADPPTWTSPKTGAGEEFYFTGGTDAEGWKKLKVIFDDKKGINDLYTDPPNYTELKEDPIDADLDPNVWTATVVVYDRDDCSNPNTAMNEGKKSITIIGFAQIRVYEVCTSLSDPSIPITGGGVAYGPEDPLPSPPEDYCVNGEKKLVAIIACNYIKPQHGGGGEFGVKGSIPGLVE